MLTKTVKTKIVKKLQTSKDDTGSASVQVGLLSRRIDELTGHLKKNKKDLHSRRGLLGLVSQRRKLLDWLKKRNVSEYEKVIKELGLKK